MKTTHHNNVQKSSDINGSDLTKEPGKYPNNALSARLSAVSQFLGSKSAIYLLLPLIGTGVAFLGGCDRLSNDVFSQATTPSQDAEDSTAEAEDPIAQSDRSLMPTAADTNFVVEVVEQVKPTVVQINTARIVRSEVPEIFEDPFFRRFFGEAVPTDPQERVVEGIGSGFVISADGRILTNAHVVNRADTVTVTFSDGRTFEGKVLGEDPLTDIAVVQIQADNLPTVKLGNSSQVQPGQWAIAIGNPLGLEESVTVGVISATERSGNDIGVSDLRVGFIQTDAAINPGNSGAPLLNARGEVIGVNTAIIGGAQGLGFAIPVDTAQRIAQQLITEGEVEHPYIGVQILPLSPAIQQRINSNPNRDIRIETDQGILIVEVAPGSPAAEAGLRAGDVIREINNQPVTEAEEVQRLVEEGGVGSELQIELQRRGQTLELAVRPEPLPVPAE